MAAIMRVVTFPDPPNSVVLYSTDDITMLGLLSHPDCQPRLCRTQLNWKPPSTCNEIDCFLSTPPSSSMSSHDVLRNTLMTSGTYLGDPAMPGNIRWTRQGRKYILCTSNGANVDGGADQALLSIIIKSSEDRFWLSRYVCERRPPTTQSTWRLTAAWHLLDQANPSRTYPLLRILVFLIQILILIPDSRMVYDLIFTLFILLTLSR